MSAQGTATDVLPGKAPPQGEVQQGAWLALSVLVLINLFNYLDRQIMAAMEPHIEDTFFLNEEMVTAVNAWALLLERAGAQKPAQVGGVRLLVFVQDQIAQQTSRLGQLTGNGRCFSIAGAHHVQPGRECILVRRQRERYLLSPLQ